MFGLKPELNKIKGYEKVFFANDMDSEELMTYTENSNKFIVQSLLLREWD